MRLLDQCSNCFSSASGHGDKSNERSHKNEWKNVLEKIANICVLKNGNKITEKEYYSKFYTSPFVQLKYFNAAKKYKLERKHKVKKRELLIDNLRRGSSKTTSHRDCIKNEEGEK